MDKILVRGNGPLNGKIRISGAKNSALKLLAASLLTAEPVVISNVPHLRDITSMINLLAQHGTSIAMEPGSGNGQNSHTLSLHTEKVTNTTAPYDLVKKMRASVQVLGPLLTRCGHARVSLPGGCAIGTRPIDLHLKGLEQLGAEITLEEGYVEAKAPNGLKGAEVVFPLVSVGATENVMAAACLAEGETVIKNAAREPEVGDLANFLNLMGAKISGIGTDTLTIQGVSSLSGVTYEVIPDRVETGTYMMAAAITNGELELVNTNIDLLPMSVKKMREAGIKIEQIENGVKVSREHDTIQGVDVITEPFPGFATDLQAQFMALMTVAQGASMITETIFENRFMHVPELARMGADITVHGSSAMVRGVKGLKGAPVMATDIRASVSLILAGLIADGETLIDRVYHLDRGYDRIEEKLRACGADIQRISA